MYTNGTAASIQDEAASIDITLIAIALEMEYPIQYQNEAIIVRTHFWRWLVGSDIEARLQQWQSSIWKRRTIESLLNLIGLSCNVRCVHYVNNLCLKLGFV